MKVKNIIRNTKNAIVNKANDTKEFLKEHVTKANIKKAAVGTLKFTGKLALSGVVLLSGESQMEEAQKSIDTCNQIMRDKDAKFYQRALGAGAKAGNIAYREYVRKGTMDTVESIWKW